MNRSLRHQTPDRQPVSRLPLYPIGSTINHQPYQPIYQMPKKFSSFANMTLPSYHERLIEKQKQFSRVKIPHQELERKLVSTNEAELDNENRRRRLMEQSYLREIQRLRIILSKGDERKEKLLSEVELLEKDRKQLHSKVDEAKASMPRYQPPQGLENKQLDVMELKGVLVSKIKQKQEEYLKQRVQQQTIWQQKLRQKQKTLITYEQQRSSAKNELLKLRREQDVNNRQLPCAIADMARSRKYQQFKYQFDVLKQKISKINQQRLLSTREYQSTNQIKTTIIKDQEFKLQTLRRMKRGLQQNLNQISLRNNQLSKTNQSLEQQNRRNNMLISLYEKDIAESRMISEKNDAEIQTKINQFRGRQNDEDGLYKDIGTEIENLKRLVREVQSDTYRLRGDFKKIGEYLESEISQSIYRTFNDVKAT